MRSRTLATLVTVTARAGFITLVATSGCGLPLPPDPPPFECDAIDRAAERFPEECGDEGDGDETPDGGAD